MKGVSTIHRLYLGIMTGVFMFAAYFLMDMFLVAAYPEIYDSWFKQNEMYYIMATFAIGIIFSQIYIYFYNRGIRKARLSVKTNAS